VIRGKGDFFSLPIDPAEEEPPGLVDDDNVEL
jgi:hypothetical protein